MRTPKPSPADSRPTMERNQGSIGGTGVNKIARDMTPANSKVEQVVMKNRYGLITPTQKS